MDPSGFEPEASAFQGGLWSTCKGDALPLSYGPKIKKGAKIENKKEVIQPQVPLRLPCDDLTHLTEFRFVLPKKTNLT
jgi:hypothetical protein